MPKIWDTRAQIDDLEFEMKRDVVVTVRGRQHEWSILTTVPEPVIEDWRNDGLEVFIVQNWIPEWVASFGLSRPWCFFQDILKMY